MHTLTIAKLRAMSDDQLIEEFDAMGRGVGLDMPYCLDELARRNSSRQTEAILAYTRQLRTMTILVTLFTLINVLAAVALVFR
jgi:hypothetical protein